MDGLDLLVLLLFAAAAWLWFDSLKVRETAVAAARAACEAEHLLLLDDTVAIAHLGFRRGRDGVLRLSRVYAFEYSDTGNDRSAGRIAMHGHRVRLIDLDRRVAAVRPLLH
jgi:hypothetical protein